MIGFLLLVVGQRKVKLGSRFAHGVLLSGGGEGVFAVGLLQNVVSAVKLLSLLESNLFEHIVFVGGPFLLFHKQVVG